MYEFPVALKMDHRTHYDSNHTTTEWRPNQRYQLTCHLSWLFERYGVNDDGYTDIMGVLKLGLPEKRVKSHPKELESFARRLRKLICMSELSRI
jgi:hypothetical protein